MTRRVTDWVLRRATLSPDAPALLGQGGQVTSTYRAWDRRIAQAARWLVERGVVRGDRIAVLARNRTETLDLLFACGRLGAVLQPLNWRLSAPELDQLVRRHPPRLLLSDAAATELVTTLQALHAPTGPLAALDDGAVGEPFAPSGLAPYDASHIDVLGSDPWVLAGTGGSTGLPKAAILTHDTILWNAVNTCASWGLTGADVAILDAPLFHAGGLGVFTLPLVHAGGASVVCPGFDPARTFDLLDARVPTVLFGVPSMLATLVDHARWRAADLSGLRLVITGGSPAPERLFSQFGDKGALLRLGYGLTEAGPNNFWLPAAEARRKPGRVGYPLLHVECRLTDDQGRDVQAVGAVGELLLRGPHVTPGYLGDAEATRHAIDASGWLHTGDLATRDADGCFAIVGRRKEMFISGGENVYPSEVEAVLQSHPDMVDAAVAGIADEHWGEVGAALLVARSPIDPGALTTFLRARLAAYKIPKSFTFVPDLPRTGAGKLDRAAVARLVTPSPELPQ